MKRHRVRAVGLGIALWAGAVHGADEPKAPAMLPVAVRAGDWSPAPAVPAETVWLPARDRAKPQAAEVEPATVRIPAAPVVVAPLLPPKPATTSISLPEIPAVPAAPVVVPTTPPAPFPAIPPTMPVLPEIVSAPSLPAIPEIVPAVQPKSDPLPPPRTATPPVIPPARELPEPPKAFERELPTAPPELMVPPGVPVPGKHGTFGSPNVRISKDYPSVQELMDHDIGWWRKTEPDPANLATDRLELRVDFLLWWANRQQVPVLATTSTDGGFGFLGQPGTAILQNSGAIGNSLRTGMRIRGGYWFDDCGTCGIDAGFFFLGKQTSSIVFDSSNTPTITRPIFAPNFPGEFGEIVAMPGLSTGALTIDTSNRIWGFDVNLRKALRKDCDFRSEVFAGYRFLGMNESITINEYITALPGNPNDPPGTRVTVTDSFETKNRFNGGQIGYAAEKTFDRWSLDGRASIALGNTHQTLDIAGYQTRLRPGMTTPDTFAGGLLATGPNLGHFTRDRFSVVPEVTVNAGYWLTPVIKAYVGYNFLYWSNVLRAGDQIDRTVDVTFVPNPPPGVPFSGQYRPQPTFQQGHLLLNGIQFGIMGRW
jgi:hypothetical protein